MATYTEIRGLFGNDDLRNRVTSATVVAAYSFLTSTPTADQKTWALSVFSSPDSVGRQVFMAVLAANRSASVGNITSATDTAIQSNVDAVAQDFVDALAGV